MHRFYRFLYRTLIALGRPVGGIRPRRLYDWLARRAFPEAQFQWFTNRWGDQLHLSHFYHIDRNILIFGTYDAALHQALERLIRPGMIVMDVGANLGEMSLHMARRVGIAGQVWAFEPVPEIFQRLTRHIARNNAEPVVRAVQAALSDTTGHAAIAAPDEQADNQGLGSIANLSAKAGPRRIDIQTITLDEFVQRERIERIDLMKIDIQGAESRLVAGGRRTLREMGPDLLMEFSPDDLRHVGQTSRDLANDLASLDYKLFPLTPGGFGPAIDVATIPRDFEATNVLCRRRGPES